MNDTQDTLGADVLKQLPRPSTRNIAIHINSSAEKHIRQGHPWLFEGAIRNKSHEGACGDLAVLFDKKERFLAVGLYDPFSMIRVKVLHSLTPVKIGIDFFRDRIQGAFALRKPLETTGTTGYRLIHGENDLLPGLIVDRYDKTLVLKIYSLAWVPHLKNVIEVLVEVMRPQRIILRVSRDLKGDEEWMSLLKNGVLLWGEPLAGYVGFTENGLEFEADVCEGQKTGFFFDQRDNRSRVESMAKGKKVLDLFSYVGGFSLYAARGGAHQVTLVDASRQALDMSKQIFKLNHKDLAVRTAKHETVKGDAFDVLKSYARRKEYFDMVIVDPPAFAKKEKDIANALGGYELLTKQALDVLKRQGILVFASCSTRVKKDDFFQSIIRAARRCGRPLAPIAKTGHAIDHPIGFREGEYLKCLFAAADR